MTVKQFIKKHGWNISCDMSTPHRYMNVNVVFENNGQMDETQFSIKSFNGKELSTLFTDFCKENNLPANTVINIVVVQTAEKMEDLD